MARVVPVGCACHSPSSSGLMGVPAKGSLPLFLAGAA
jgi:hypothetical protein